MTTDDTTTGADSGADVGVLADGVDTLPEELAEELSRDASGLPPDDDTVTAPPAKRKLDKGLLAACFVIAAGLTLIIWGLWTAQTGDEGIDRPEVIENLSPVENAIQVLQQETIVVDFEFGFEAELILDGILIETTRIGELDLSNVEPGQQIETPPTAVFDPGNARLEFRPSEGAQIEELTEGRHTATVIYWPIDEGRESARSYTWSFDVI